MTKEKCDCTFCKFSREFEYHLTKIPDEKTVRWFRSFFEQYCGIEEDLEVHKIYQKNLFTLYPRIWNETTTIVTLNKDNARFPQIQI